MTVEAEVTVDAGEGARHRVRLRAEDDEPLTTLWSQLEILGVGANDTLFVEDRAIDRTLTWDSASLVDGAVLSVGVAGSSARLTQPSGLELRLIGGHAAGWRYPLPPGRHLLGRAKTADLVIPDPTCGREHAIITVGPDSVVIEDLDSANGTMVEGAWLEPRVGHHLERGDRVQVGSTLLELVEPIVEPVPLTTHEGRIGFNRRFRAAPPTFVGKIDLPREPSAQDPPPLNLLLTIAPAAAMAAMAIVLNRPEFLLFAAMSPLLGIGRAVSQRRQYARRAKAEREQYETDRATMATRLIAAVRAERDARTALVPDLAELCLQARLPGRRLWDRQPTDEDFLQVRVGAADQPSTVQVTGDEDVAAPTLWRSPLSMGLKEVGNLSIVGPRDRSRGVAASLVAQLVVRESPSNLRVVVVTDEEGRGAWEWATWLPHCRWEVDDRFRLVGSDSASRRTRLAELTSLVKARRSRAQQHRDVVPIPAVVVVLDDTTQALTEGYAELLNDGPAAGVHAICLDEVQIPAQCHGSIAVPAVHLDEGVVDQRGRAAIGSALIDQPEPTLLAAVARALAPLVPLGDANTRDLPSDVRLLDISGSPALAAGDIINRWATSSPSPGAVIGVGLGGPVSLDLTQQGPHGLVAGTTRSGKSEFLKTFVAALAMVNHPDDLSFLFIDFKGGADYRVLQRLPHSIDLSTSEDLADFERTTKLLEAEISRRGRRFDRAETTTIEGYGNARKGRPDLPPIGRLVVIADEFAELVSKAPVALERLVSVARTGAAFGIHLILATQRPAGAITGQIDANMALRVCFRVAKPEESLDVLDAPDAGSIAQRHRGRGFFRAHSEPLVEFQCARVGGARPGSVHERVSAHAELVLWHELGRVPPIEQRAEAADPDTDLWDVVEACREAAAQLGWTGSAVPWPKALPASISLEDLPASDEVGLIPFAIADAAAEQRHRAIGLPLHRGHVAVVGASQTGRTTALRSAACSAADLLTAADAHIYILDFAGGGLRPLTELPHCGGTAFDEWEQATRLVKELGIIVDQRLAHYAQTGFPGIEEQRASGEVPMPYLLLLIDGWDVINDEGTRLSLPDEIGQLLTRGLAAGVRAVVAGDRSVSHGRVGRAIADRLVLRFNDEGDYAAFGLSHRDIPETQPAGRAILSSTREPAQVALVSAGDVPEAIRALAERTKLRDAGLRDRWPRRVEPLPRQITLDQLTARGEPPIGGRVVPVGLGAEQSEPRYIDLVDLAGAYIVAGPPRSGRTTTLRAMATALSGRGTRVALVVPKTSTLADLAGLPHVVATIIGPEARQLDLSQLVDAEVVLIDDADLLDEGHEAHTDLVSGRQSIVIAGDLGVLGDASRGWLGRAKRSQAGLVLSPRSRQDGSVLGTRLTDDLVFSGPPGRGVAGIAGRLEVVQVPVV